MTGLRYSPLHVTEFCGEMQGKFKVSLARLIKCLFNLFNIDSLFTVMLYFFKQERCSINSSYKCCCHKVISTYTCTSSSLDLFLFKILLAISIFLLPNNIVKFNSIFRNYSGSENVTSWLPI